jgi:hypothetical protein
MSYKNKHGDNRQTQPLQIECSLGINSNCCNKIIVEGIHGCVSMELQGAI